MVAWRYEISLLMLKNISNTWREISANYSLRISAGGHVISPMYLYNVGGQTAPAKCRFRFEQHTVVEAHYGLLQIPLFT